MKNQNQKGIASALAIIIVIIIGIIAIGGVLAYQYLAKTEPEEQPSPLDATVDWNVYRNEQYGYKIKYPSDELPQASFVCHHASGEVDEEAIKFSNLDMYVYICVFERNYQDLAMAGAFSIVIDGHKALVVKSEIRGGGRVWYFIEVDSNSTLMIDSFWGYDEDLSYKEKEETFNQMLSTFRWIE